MLVIADWYDELFSHRTLGVALWIGLAVMTVVLLILSRTRWGQAKPLSKCVALSVFAHVLLIGYAYGTRLIFDYPALDTGEPMQLSIMTDEDQNESPEHAEEVEDPKPWEKFATTDPVQPKIAQAVRQSVDGTQRIEPHVDLTVPQVKALPRSDAAVIREPDRPKPSPSKPNVTAPRRPVEAVDSVEQPKVTSSQEANQNMVIPGIAELPRFRDAKPHGIPMLKNALRDPSGGSANSEFQAPKLHDIPFVATSADALKTARDAARRDLLRQNLPQMPDLPKNETESSSGYATKRRLGDGQPLPEAYSLRFSGDRLKVARQFGGSEQTEAAVRAALKWLAAHQRSDGRWDADALGAGRETNVLGHNRQGAGAKADTGLTGLALLAFLGAGHTHFEGDYAKYVQRGLEFLLQSQATDGGLGGEAEFFAKMYCHGMATLALSEAYAITGDHRLKPYVRRAVNFSVGSQHPTNGGWRYKLRDETGDMSQFGWQVMALSSAELAGISIPRATLQAMLKFLRSASSGSHGGLASYRPAEVPSRTMTAEALACRLFLGQTDRQAIDEAATYIDQRRPSDGVANLYYWYYATLALRQVSDGRWRRWSAALQSQLVRRQRKDGGFAGSWDHDTVWGGYGGRVFSTALAALCLESYYRYLPLLKQ